jgi:putative hydrolase of HD superfamily
MYKKYVTVNEEKAVRELTETLFFGDEVKAAIHEFNEKKTKESLIAHDADQLSLILQLKEYGDLGNKYTKDWIEFARKRLCTDTAKKLADSIIATDSSQWWFKDKSNWWINGGSDNIT